jgi:hypothetical protein
MVGIQHCDGNTFRKYETPLGGDEGSSWGRHADSQTLYSLKHNL